MIKIIKDPCKPMQLYHNKSSDDMIGLLLLRIKNIYLYVRSMITLRLTSSNLLYYICLLLWILVEFSSQCVTVYEEYNCQKHD